MDKILALKSQLEVPLSHEYARDSQYDEAAAQEKECARNLEGKEREAKTRAEHWCLLD